MRFVGGLNVLNVAIMSLTVVGCSTVDGPVGLPALVPTTISITQGGAPLEGATVSLFPQDSANKQWAAGGTTDATGTAVIQTLGRYNGAAAGKYKVTVYKSLQEDASSGVPDSPSSNKVTKNYLLVDPKLTSEPNTTLEMNISAPETTQTFDIGAAVKVLEKAL